MLTDRPITHDVVTIGSAVLDVLLKSRAFKLIESPELPGGVAICEVYEGKVEADEIELVSGGGGTNNAVSFSRKGLRTAIIAEMGADITGKMIIAELIREGVDTRYLVVEEGEETGVSVVLVSGEGGRSIVTYRGASGMLNRKDIPWKALRTKWLHISSLGGQIELLKELVDWAKRHEVKTAVNPGKGELRQKRRLWQCVRKVDVLLLNREEAAMLTDIDFRDTKIYRSEACLVGPTISVITAGDQGGKVCAHGKCLFYKGSAVKTVSSVGAGDAFGSGLVAALICGKDVTKAIEWGRKNAQSVLGALSAKRGLLTRPQLEQESS